MTNDSTKTATAAKASGDSSTANPTEAKTFSVALVNITDGTVSGHKAGCADLKRGNLRKHADDAWELTVADKAEAWVAYNSDFLAEGGEDNGHTIEWAACAKAVPAGDQHARYVEQFEPVAKVGIVDGKVTVEEPKKATPAKAKKATAKDKANGRGGSTAKARATAITNRAAARNAAPVEAAAQADHDSRKAQQTAALEKAREARVANMAKPAPVVDGITWGLSGKHHGLVEGSTFLFHGTDKKAPTKKGQRLTMVIVDRVWITGVDSKKAEQMRVHIAGSFWATDVKAPAKKATPAKASEKAPAKKATPARAKSTRKATTLNITGKSVLAGARAASRKGKR